MAGGAGRHRDEVVADGDVPPDAQDPPYRRLANVMAEPGWFAMHPALAPGRGSPVSVKLQVRRLVRTLSVPVRGCQPFRVTAGTDI